MKQAKEHTDPLDAMRLRAEAAEAATERVKRKLARTLAERDEARAEAAAWQERAERAERGLVLANTIHASPSALATALSRLRRPTPSVSTEKLLEVHRLAAEDKLMQKDIAARLDVSRPVVSQFLRRKLATPAAKAAYAEIDRRKPRKDR